MSDYAYDREMEYTGSNLGALFFLFCALFLHVGVLFAGFKFIRWQLEESESTASRVYSLITCFERGEENDPQEPKSLTHREAAGLITLTLWLLIFGAVSACWPWWIFPFLLIIPGLILAKYYTKGGAIDHRHRFTSLFGTLAFVSALATTAAYFLQLCHVRYPMTNYGGPPAGFVAFKVSFFGTFFTMIFATAARCAYKAWKAEQAWDTGTVASKDDTVTAAVAPYTAV